MAIKVKLAVKMAEQQIRTIAELSRRTGLARQTLTALWRNSTRGISLETLDKLCEALGCQPGDLLEYVPTQKTGQE